MACRSDFSRAVYSQAPSFDSWDETQDIDRRLFEISVKADILYAKICLIYSKAELKEHSYAWAERFAWQGLEIIPNDANLCSQLFANLGTAYLGQFRFSDARRAAIIGLGFADKNNHSLVQQLRGISKIAQIS